MKNLILLLLVTFSLNAIAQTEYDKLVEEGLQLLIQQNISAAIEKYEAAYKLDSTKVEANYGLGVVYLYNCRYIGENCFTALSYLNKAIQIDSTYRRGYHNRGICRNLVKDFNGALEDYNKAIKKEPLNSKYYIGRALTYKSLNDKENLCKDLHKANELNAEEIKEVLTNEGCN